MHKQLKQHVEKMTEGRGCQHFTLSQNAKTYKMKMQKAVDKTQFISKNVA